MVFLIGGIWKKEDFFLYSLISKTSPQCNIPNGNQQNESKVLIYFSDRSHLERTDLGKISGG